MFINVLDAKSLQKIREGKGHPIVKKQNKQNNGIQKYPPKLASKKVISNKVASKYQSGL